MNKRTAIKIVNWIMMAALIIVVVSGTLLHGMGASMWMGITHGLSGYVLLICAIIHFIQHRRK
ncbi:MAG: hypothetical protein J6B94_03335 [Lachnospiraceae bacterium]|nr:hypothetical protein [Lachnospiraceae bacterium]